MTNLSKQEIQDIIDCLAGGNLAQEAYALFKALGYRSGRTGNSSGAVGDFLTHGGYKLTGTESEATFKEQAKAVHILFQITEDEIKAGVGNMLGEDVDFNSGNNKSFVFVVSELCEDSYSRSQYAAFTREINKRLPMPVVVLFRTASGRVSLAFVHRRPSKVNTDRDVLGHVSLVREVNTQAPHRAHLQTLQDLCLHRRLEWIRDHSRDENFDGLLDAWLVALDTQELNKQFYKELFDWFKRAVAEASFPESAGLKPEEQIIRLITRLLFIWFIKEKGLVADELFVEEQVGGLLKDYDRDSGDSYYRAVLQNLFFAVLNTEIGERRFSKQTNETHRDFSCYRYRKEIVKTDRLLAMFDKTPFINGGLFDCLDDFEGVKEGGKRIDYFTDNPAQRRGYSMPNHLFFGPEGLITLFSRYHFTVEENTPIEREVALDPELLGRTFENLLAAYNPETRDKASERKLTGSFYTPREVVDYMVDQALLESLAALVTTDEASWWRDRLGYLLDYADACDDAWELFDAEERKRIVAAVAKVKILDPAVGSGAFPMGVLHKLTLILRRLDPDNKKWRKVQRDLATERASKAFKRTGKEQRKEALQEINELFESYSGSDFGRKLYLIQNSIFGVDIQPIACQIAKLRFFISLAIEQRPNKNKQSNYGIRPLPNLETRFIAADSLINILIPSQLTMVSDEKENIKQEIKDNRECYFHAATRSDKKAMIEKDKDLRIKLADLLWQEWGQGDAGEIDGANLWRNKNKEHKKEKEYTDKIAQWDPYDQNSYAGWFNSEYMFDITEGFDIVIGNPPYIQLQKIDSKMKKLYMAEGYKVCVGNGDIYTLFYERGLQLLKDGAHLCFITSNKWMCAGYGKKLRELFSQKCPKNLIDFSGFRVFDSATVDTNIILIAKANMPADGKLQATSMRDDFSPENSIHKYVEDNKIDIKAENLKMAEAPWIICTPAEFALKEKIERIGVPLKEWDISINYGIKTGCNDAFIIDNETREALLAEDSKSGEILKPLLRGRDIKRYRAKRAEKWLITTHNGYGDVPPIDIGDYPAVKRHLDRFHSRIVAREDQGTTPYNLRHCAYYPEFMRDKIVWSDISTKPAFTMMKAGVYLLNTAYMITTDKPYLLAFLNSKLAGYYMSLTATGLGGHGVRYFKQFVEKVPVPKISDDKHKSFANIADRILNSENQPAHVTKLERDIDHLVYALYDFTDAEIQMIESYQS